MASVDETCRQERLFIARCADVRALLDRMAEYRDAQASAQAWGYTEWRLRLGELLELAEARVVELKARELARTEARPELRGAVVRSAPPVATPRPQAPGGETPARAPARGPSRAGPVAPTSAAASRAEPAKVAPPALTGADLVRWRKQRGLTQRAAATLLGVAHGTVGKAEMVPRRALGEALTVALGRVREGERGGG